MATLNGPFPSGRRERSASPDGDAPRLIQGLDGVVQSNAAASQEMRSAVREMALANDRALRMTSTVEALARNQVELMRLIGAGAPGAILSATGSFPTAQAPVQPLAPTGGAPVPSPAGMAPTTPDRTGERKPTVPAGVPTSEAPEAVENYKRLQDAQHYTIAQLRTDAGRWLGRTVSETRIGPALRPAANRRGWEVFDPSTDEALGAATHAQIRNMNIANRVRAIGGTVAEQGLGRGLINALPKGAIGPAAVAVGGVMVANEAAQFFENQREANSAYQRALGGSNLEGLGERARQALFSLGQRGTMSDRESAALYEGVTSLGMTGERRQEALDFAIQNWRQFGMEVNQSLVFIRENAKNGITGLTGVAEALSNVTDAAREAQISADAARQNYAQAYSSAAPNLLGTGSAAIATGALSTAFTSLGSGFQGVDFSGMLSTDVIRMIGARQGMTQAETLAATSGVTGGQTLTRMTQAAVIDLANRLLGTRGRQMISQFKQARGISGTLSASQADELATEMYAANIVQPSAIISSFQAMFRVSLDARQALTLLIMALDGGWNPEASIQDQVANSTTSSQLSAAGRSNFGTDDVAGVSTMGEVLNAIGADPMLDTYTDPDTYDANGNLVKGETRLTMSTQGGRGRQQIIGAQGLYANQISEGKMGYSPIIGALLKQGDYEQKFRINVGTEANPQWREMGVYDAIKYHADQLARGDVQITAGTGEGQYLYSALGLSKDESVNVNYDKSGADVGSALDASATTTSRGGVVTGGIEVYASDELRRFLRFRVTDSSMVVAPPSAITAPSGLATGN